MMQNTTIQNMLTRLRCSASEPGTAKRTRVLGAFLSIALFLLMGVAGIAQINYTESFAGCNATTCANWEITGGFGATITSTAGSGYTPCTTGNPAAKSNIYSYDQTTTLRGTASLGTSSGTTADFNFNYKGVTYGPGAPAAAGMIDFSIEYSETSATGPYTVVATFTNVSTATCIAAPVTSFTPTAGLPIYMRIVVSSPLSDADGFYAVIDDISLTQSAGSACTATPTPGNTITSNATPCSGASFTLSLQNISTGDGITYQWQRADDAGFSVNLTALGTSSTQATSHTAPYYYRCIVSCPNSVPTDGTSTGVLVNVNTDNCQCATYPAVFASSASDEDLGNVTVGAMSNTSDCAVAAGGSGSLLSRYGNYAGIVTGPIQAQGDIVSFSLTQTSCGGAYGNGIQLYADWNQDGDFLDVGEQLYNQPLAANGAHTETGTFTVPVNATLGSTRMRAVVVETTFPTATNYAQTAYTWGETEDYCFTVTAGSGCAGTPTPGNTITSNTTPCTGANFTLSLQNNTPGSDVAYQWQSADDAGFTVNLTALGTNATQVTSHTTAKYYRCIVSCPSAAPADGTSTEVFVDVNTDNCACGTYSATFATYTGDEELSNVTVGGMNNTSDCVTAAGGAGSILERYSNFTGIVTGPTQDQGDVVSFSITQTTCGGNYGSGIQLYVDWNQDGDFLDANEQVYNQPTANAVDQTVTGTFTVPVTATIGSTRMRAVVVEGGFPSATNFAETGYGWGETEDYCFTVTAGSACTGTPAPGNTVSSSASVCPGEPFTLSLQNLTPGTGLSYQWFNTGGAISGATSSTLVTSQVVADTYHAEVYCGSNTGTSADVSVSVNAIPAFVQDFETATITPGCWSIDDVDGVLILGATSAFGIGTGSAEFNYYNAFAGTEMSLISPAFAAVPASYEVAFDAAGAAYPGSIDVINLETSADGGNTWTILQTMTNEDGIGVLNTGGAVTGPYAGPSGEWTSLSYPIPTGTDRIRFRAVSDYGNNIYIDNVDVHAIPTCFPPTGIIAAGTSTTTGTVTWNTTVGETYSIEVRSSGAAGSGLVGLDDSGTALAGPTFNATGLTPNTNYLAYIKTDCGVDGLSAWSMGQPFRTGLCVANVNFPGGLNDFNITPVIFADINNPSSSTGGYEDFTSVVGHVVPGQTYTLSIGRATNYTFDQFQVYINWNQDLDFDDVGEAVFSSALPPAVGGAVVVNITVPANALPGDCIMRIRRQYDGDGVGPNYTACGNSDYGQVEDYTLNVCAPVDATVEITAVCGTSMDAEVTINNLGSGAPASGTITYSVNSGAPVTVAAVIGVNSLTAMGMVANSTDTITINVGNGTVCDLALGSYYSNCPVVLDCNAPAVQYSYCYKNNDARTFHYIAEPGQTVALNFIQGGLGASDIVNFFDGPNGASPSLGGGNFNGDLTPADFLSTGQDMFIEISSNGSNSCADGGQSVEWVWTVGCTPDCIPPSGEVTYTDPAVECNPPGFFLDVLLYDAGSSDAGNTMPLFEADIVWTIDGVSNPAYIEPNVAVFTPTQIGPFPLGSIVNVTFVHGTNSACNNNKGNFTQANTCPPANDLCDNAEVLPINAIGGCPGSAVQGTTSYATYDNVPVTCNGGAGNIQDVWYRFNTGVIANPIQVRFTAGTAVGYSAEFYPGNGGPTCLGASFGCIASAAGGVNLTLAANTDYYIRVFTNSGTGTAGTFGICVAGSSCPAPTAQTATFITDYSANIGWTGAAGNYIVEYGPSATFTAASVGGTSTTGGSIATGSTNPITISGLAPSTNYRFFVRRDCGSGVYSFNTNFGLFTTLVAPPPPTTILHNTCAQAAVIPDAGCATNNVLTAQFAVTTVGTGLGVDVQLESVDLIIPHTWRSDLQISLVSPTGQIRSLISNRGGSGDNFGNNATCPTSYMRLINGGQALASMTTAANIVGNWAPEQAFTGLTGDPNGNWKLRICDGAGGDTGTLQFVRLNFVPCVGPTYTLTALPDCGNGQYSIGVNITSMGTASSYLITNNVNGSTATATSTGSWNIGPFPTGSVVTLNLAHNVNASCNSSIGPVQYNCVPANDLCANATPVGCNTTTAGTTAGGTNTGAPTGTCGTTLNTAPGVWYTVQGWGGSMTASLCGAGFDTKMGVFTGSCGAFTCIAGNDDFCGLQSQVTWAGTSGTTYYVYVTAYLTNSGPFNLKVTCGDVNPACTENGLFLEFQNDANPGQVTWEILNQSGNVVVLSGNDPIPAMSIGTQALCLPDGCYRLRVLDSAGDGMTTGGYALREDGGARIIDNTNNFSTGSVSSVAGGFCLPLGTSDLIYSSCDKLDWVNYKYLVCHAIPAVAAEWVPSGANNVQDANSGYEFWIFDPNGSYSFRKFHAHNVSDGFSPASANRACRMKINGWYNSALTPLIPQNMKLNVRVRGRVNGVNQNFGPACIMRLDAAAAACPLARLQDDPSNTNDYSCGVNRTWGGTNTGANKIVARPPQFWPAPFGGGTGVRYQFRFRIPAEQICIVRPAQASPTLYLNWTNGTALQASKTYEVEVRVSKDLGATWCVDVPTPACDPAPVTAWGKVCNVTITSANVQGGASSMSTTGDNGFTMYPNPNRGDQLVIALSSVAPDVLTVGVDIYNLTGQRVTARTIAVQDGYLNTTIDLNGDLSGGMYMVNITAGDKTYTQRLVIQP